MPRSFFMAAPSAPVRNFKTMITDQPVCPYCRCNIPWDPYDKPVVDGEEHTFDCPKCSRRLTQTVHATYKFSVVPRVDKLRSEIASVNASMMHTIDKRYVIGESHVDRIIATKKSKLSNLEFEMHTLLTCQELDK